VLEKVQSTAVGRAPLAAGGLDLLAGGRDEAGLPLMDFVEAIGRQQAAVMAPGTTKERLLAHRFAAGIDRAAFAVGVLQPAGDQTPLGEAHLRPALLLPLDQQWFTGPHLLPRLVVLEQTLRQRTLEPGEQLIDRGGERVAATHQRCLRIESGRLPICVT
jgi:hypothetical protein